MKYAKYILFLVAFVFASCTIDDDTKQGEKGNKIQFVSRVVPFNEHDVNTRGDITTEEGEIKSLDYFIFAYVGEGDIETDENRDNWACVFYRHSENSVVLLDKTVDFEGFYDEDAGEFTNPIFNECYVAVVANYPAVYEKIGGDFADQEVHENFDDYVKDKVVYGYKTDENGDIVVDADYLKLSEVLALTEKVESIFEVPSTGLPRLGNYVSKDDNGTEINFVNLNTLVPGKPYTVNLKSLYAKMVFDIAVDPNQQSIKPNDDDFVANVFTFEEYTIYNIPKSIDFDPNTNALTNDGRSDEQKELLDSIRKAVNTQVPVFTFSFYLPERLFTPGKSANDYPYPFRQSDGSIRPEDMELRQRYKPKLVEKGDGTTDATYVKIKGVFQNHQGHLFNVEYDIYVGSDNYGNFNVERNKQYNNIITIRGIDNSSDQSTNTQESVSIDHRVNVTRSSPVIISFRRETMLDSHFEVRPMRIRAKGQPSEGQAVRVKVTYQEPTGDGAKWVGLERSFGNGEKVTALTDAQKKTYCIGKNALGIDNTSAIGKRKYFTTNLTKTELAGVGNENNYSKAGGQTVIVPVTTDGECIWVYVDECDEEEEASTMPGATRSAIIEVTYGKIENGTFTKTEEPITYTIKQHLLYKIKSNHDLNNSGTTTDDYYYIEYEEEYLHNFDSEDTYSENLTEFEGMEWGLDGVQLSHIYDAIYISAESTGFYSWILDLLGIASLESLANDALKEMGWNPKYDFYLPRDVESFSETIRDKLTARAYSGYTFNNEIAQYLLATYSSSPKAKIARIQLDEMPQSAFAYCYNRNKRDSDGDVEKINWYMPSIDELEEIMELAHLNFEDFQGKLYWSCQSSYEKNAILFEYWNKESIFGSFKQGTSIDGTFYLDDLNRARATRVERENGEFKEVLSSAADFSGTQNGALYITSSIISPSSSFEPKEYVQNPNFDNTFKNYPGNLSRTGTKCRVRAVRKMN